jgi:dTDP-glucose 4,6-dehydratase
MNVLVTGGCGFIGSNFIHYCLDDAQVKLSTLVNLDKLTYAGNPANLADKEASEPYHFVQADIADSGLVSKLLVEHEIDLIINFAAESHVDRSIDSPEPFLQTNAIGTLRLLEATRHYWETLPTSKKEEFRFLHVSTDEVYGSLQKGDPGFTEETPFAPNSPYSASKASSDHLVRAYFHTYGLPVITTNCSNNYGPYQFPEKLIPLMILNSLEGKPLPIYGDGQNIRDWLYVKDHCEAIWLVAQKGGTGETYNIGGECERTNMQIVHAVCEILDQKSPSESGKSYKEQIHFVKDRPGHDFRYSIDCQKIKETLNWKPKETFESGIEKTIDWYLSHLDWCKNITENNYQRERLGTS